MNLDLEIYPSASLMEVIVSFELTDTEIPIQDLRFFLERSETEVGPWELVSKILHANTMKDATALEVMAPGVSLFYKVSVKQPSVLDPLVLNLLSEKVGQFDLRPAGKYAFTIQHNLQRHMNAVDYMEFELKKQSKTSAKCYCWDPVRMEASEPNCDVCGGTGYINSYYPPVTIKLNITNPFQNEAHFKEFFGDVTMDVTAAYGWGTADVRISTEDILINKKSREEFVVSNVNYHKPLGQLIRQSIVMKRRDKNPARGE